jgi:GNAT superfamily N-acetyltransferase
MQIGLLWVSTRDRQALDQIIALGDRSRKTLGFMPRGGFIQAADSRTLLAAIRDDHVAGYALFSLPRQVVRLTHLCVGEGVRGTGVARRLVDAISEKHADRFGITLKCRNDYPASGLWPRLGFEAQGEVKGRGRERKPLTIWWRDHGHPSLFSAPEALGLLRVSIDLNVFLDLESGAGLRDTSASRALTDDWLADQVELVVASELAVELARLPAGPEKERQHRAARKYPQLVADARAVDALAERVTEYVRKTQGVSLDGDSADQSDVRHLVEASLSGVTVLASNDEKLREWAGKTVGITSVQVMHPSDVILHVDELSRAQAYRPVQLQDTRWQLAPVRSQTEVELLTFTHGTQGERKSDYLRLIRRIAAGGRQWTRTVLRSPQDKPIAFYASGPAGDELTVPIFRVAAQDLEQTVTRQILFRLRDQARRDGCSVLRITEPNLAGETQRIIREDGFLKLGDDWLALVINACGPAAVIDERVSTAANRLGLVLPTLRPSLSAVIAADLERTLWPAKITDSLLPSYLVPIRPAWAGDLFGIRPTLTPRPNMLGLSREHVYYRSPTPRTAAPARLLWYVTDARRGGVTSVIGCSRLEESLLGKPAVLFQQFRHLGVWDLDNIKKAAKANGAEALRFADTEIFEREISLRRLKQIAAEHCHALTLRSRQKIDADLFAAIYQEGKAAK